MAAATNRAQDVWFSWVVCASCFLIQVVLGGFLYTPGMFYIMFKDGLDASDSALSFITSLNICVVFSVCPFIGLLTDRYGERVISLIGASLSTIALAISSFSTQVYHLYILYGVLAGITMGMTYNSSISILPKYFNKYMRVANSIMFTGSGVGSFILPPILDTLERKYGWRGAILLMAGLNAQTLICCSFFRPIQTIKNGNIKADGAEHNTLEKSGTLCEHDKVCWKRDGCEVSVQPGNNEMDSMLPGPRTFHSRNSSTEGDNSYDYISSDDQNDNTLRGDLKERQKETHNKQENSVKLKLLSLFKSDIFLCLMGLSLFSNFSLCIVGTHFGNYALTLGYSKADVVLLYMVWGISSTISRLMVGIVAQITQANIGALMMAASFFNGVLTILLPHTNQLWLLYVFVVLHQLMIAVYCILNFPCIVESTQAGQASVGIGLAIVCCIPGSALGPPLAAWMYESTSGYSSSFYLSGVLLIMAGMSMVFPAYRTYKLRTQGKGTQHDPQDQ